MSETPIGAFPRVAGDIQTVLSHGKNDWIIYLQSNAGDFNLYGYPEEVVVAEVHAKVAKALLKR